ncbi:MAG: hypothetical protein ABIQ34_06245, partial [Tepidiformaceae bacterium]
MAASAWPLAMSAAGLLPRSRVSPSNANMQISCSTGQGFAAAVAPGETGVSVGVEGGFLSSEQPAATSSASPAIAPQIIRRGSNRSRTQHARKRGGRLLSRPCVRL